MIAYYFHGAAKWNEEMYEDKYTWKLYLKNN